MGAGAGHATHRFTMAHHGDPDEHDEEHDSWHIVNDQPDGWHTTSALLDTSDGYYIADHEAATQIQSVNRGKQLRKSITASQLGLGVSELNPKPVPVSAPAPVAEPTVTKSPVARRKSNFTVQKSANNSLKQHEASQNAADDEEHVKVSGRWISKKEARAMGVPV